MTILYIIQKEFIQIFRQKVMIAIIFAMPIIQLVILGFAATQEIKNSRLTVIDHDKSSASRELINHFVASGFFTQTDNCSSHAEALAWIADDKSDQILEIPDDFGKQLSLNKPAEVQLITNAINGSAAGVTTAYAQQIITNYGASVNPNQSFNPVNLTERYWFNPQLNSQNYIIPGIVVILITIIGFFMGGMNVVREKEIGTIDQINVTPIKKYQFIIGKLLPFLIIGLFDFALGLVVAKIVFSIPFVGSLGLIFLFAAVYLILMLGFALLISTVSDTQQQSLFLSWFFIVIFILLSGLFTPVESMPSWVKYINAINPLAYFIEVMRLVLLKGAQFRDVSTHFFGLLTVSIGMVSLSVWRYKKRS